MQEAFEQAVVNAGGQSELSRRLSERGTQFSQQLIWHHLRVKKRCPAEIVLAVEGISGISRHLLRPDVFGAEEAPGGARAA
ncbi:hypothetical protein N878_02865 [Pseudomonas sp. EGD-AK9]|uniref:YdaS family helix-turn-helix protein n=1 Tax=Pseudomonas sp. EGD-AK9 TaxID=1386078 RepID=UPI0003962D49|nr:YdaS family helix-turn-helix protein [Pseudomonas sp. EGD-AK9]ERI54111.1 hypothetical protein N878_02865 [Pseudomonas sp. EGD-AK9]